MLKITFTKEQIEKFGGAPKVKSFILDNRKRFLAGEAEHQGQCSSRFGTDERRPAPNWTDRFWDSGRAIDEGFGFCDSRVDGIHGQIGPGRSQRQAVGGFFGTGKSECQVDCHLHIYRDWETGTRQIDTVTSGEGMPH